MALHKPDSTTRRAFGHVCTSQGVQPRVLLELDGREAVTEAMTVGLGVDVVPSLEVGNGPRVRTILLIGPELTSCHLISCLEECHGLRVVRAFLELAAA